MQATSQELVKAINYFLVNHTYQDLAQSTDQEHQLGIFASQEPGTCTSYTIATRELVTDQELAQATNQTLVQAMNHGLDQAMNHSLAQATNQNTWAKVAIN